MTPRIVIGERIAKATSSAYAAQRLLIVDPSELTGRERHALEYRY